MLYVRFALALVAATAASAAAQQRTLVPGDLVQVVAPTVRRQPVRGELVRYHGDTLAVREAGTDSIVVLPMDRVRNLALNRGRHPTGSSRRTMGAGAFLGLALGAVAGPLIASRQGGDGDFLKYTAFSAGGGMLAGGTLGALLGAMFPRTHWQRYAMPRTLTPPTCGREPCPSPTATGTPE